MSRYKITVRVHLAVLAKAILYYFYYNQDLPYYFVLMNETDHRRSQIIKINISIQIFQCDYLN